MSRDSNLHIFKAWVEAYKRHDIERMMACVTDHVQIKGTTFGHAKGKFEAEGHWQEIFLAFPDLRISPATITADDHRLAAEVDFEGTNTGGLHGMPPTDRKISFRGVLIVEFDDGKIDELKTYYDPSAMTRQLGMEILQ